MHIEKIIDDFSPNGRYLLYVEKHDNPPLYFPVDDIDYLFVDKITDLIGCNKIEVRNTIMTMEQRDRDVFDKQHPHIPHVSCYNPCVYSDVIKYFLSACGGIPEMFYWIS